MELHRSTLSYTNEDTVVKAKVMSDIHWELSAFFAGLTRLAFKQAINPQSYRACCACSQGVVPRPCWAVCQLSYYNPVLGR